MISSVAVYTLVSDYRDCTVFRVSLKSNVSLILPCSSWTVLERDNGNFTMSYEVLVEIESSDIRRKALNEDIYESVGPPIWMRVMCDLAVKRVTVLM